MYLKTKVKLYENLGMSKIEALEKVLEEANNTIQTQDLLLAQFIEKSSKEITKEIFKNKNSK